MTRDQAVALCQLLDICMEKRHNAFYATAAVFGHELRHSTYRLYESSDNSEWLVDDEWRGKTRGERMRHLAADLFEDMAKALRS